MGLRPQRHEMVEVVLIEDEPATCVPRMSSGPLLERPHDEAPDGSRGAGARDWTTRFSHRLLLAGALVVVVVTASVVSTVRRDPVALGELVGSAPSLISPLAEAWRVDAPRGWSVAADLLLTTVTEADGGLAVQAHDLADGQERWRRAAPGLGELRCPTAVDGVEGPLVVCQSRGPMRRTHDHIHGFAVDPGRLLLLSRDEGHLVGEIPLDRRHTGFDAVGGDLVLARMAVASGDDHGGATRPATAHVERRDMVTGTTVWETEIRVDYHPAAAPAQVAVRGGLVLLVGLTSAILDAEDGRLLRVAAIDVARDPHRTRPALTVRPHGFAVRSGSGALRPSAQWFSLDGHELGSLDGEIAEPAVHDGSEPSIVLVSTSGGGSLRGVDALTGLPVWSVDLARGQPILRLGGAVVLHGPGTLRAVDLLTGRQLWRSSAEAIDEAHAVSDGAFVLATGQALGVGRSISAISLRDGSLLWRTEMPDGGRALRVLGQHVVAVGPGVVIGLR